jgi:hypothetical protein
MNQYKVFQLLYIFFHTFSLVACTFQSIAETPYGYVSQGKLIWMPVSSSRKTWAEAAAYCASTPINDRTSWRLPTKDELSKLNYSGEMNGQGWTLGYSWTSTPIGRNGHYVVVLDHGGIDTGIDTGSDYVTCVREENAADHEAAQYSKDKAILANAISKEEIQQVINSVSRRLKNGINHDDPEDLNGQAQIKLAQYIKSEADENARLAKDEQSKKDKTQKQLACQSSSC